MAGVGHPSSSQRQATTTEAAIDVSDHAKEVQPSRGDADTIFIMASRPADVQSASQLGDAVLGDEQSQAGQRAGTEAAFSELYHAQATGVYNLCLRLLGSPEDAQDVTQEVFIKALRQLPHCDADFRARPWLYRVAVNACYDQLRARKAHGPLEPLPDEVASPRIGAIEQAELGQLLEQTLAGLSVRQRTVLLLKDVHGFSQAEIAATLSVSRGATERLLFRARKAFRSSYSALVGSDSRHACDLARRAVVDSVGGELSERQRRRIVAHAKDCPECGETVATWSLGAFGLVAFLRVSPLPAALAAPPYAAAVVGGIAGSVGAGGAGVGAAGGAGAAGATATAGVTASGVSTGAALTAGAVVKVAVLAAAAGVLAVGGGVSVHRLVSAGGHAPVKVALVSGAKARGGAQPLPPAGAHKRSGPHAGAAARRGKNHAADRGRTSGTSQSATHAQNWHAAGSGSAAKAQAKHAVARGRAHAAHHATPRPAHAGKKPTAKKKPMAKKKPTAKSKAIAK